MKKTSCVGALFFGARMLSSNADRAARGRAAGRVFHHPGTRTVPAASPRRSRKKGPLLASGPAREKLIGKYVQPRLIEPRPKRGGSGAPSGNMIYETCVMLLPCNYGS